jgi:Transposase DDE domain
MHVQGFLHKMLSSVMHKKRLETLTLCITAVLKTKKLSLSELGRALKLPKIKERSAIRRSDRILGNKKLHAERDCIHQVVIEKIIGTRTQIDIIVDWSSIPNTTHHTLRAAMVADGRALTLYEEVHPEKKLGNKKIQNKFLQKLKKLLPKKCKAVIITAAGFHNDFFKEVIRLDWDFLGRVRGRKYLKKANEEWQLCKDLFRRATSTPKYIGKVELCKSNSLELNLCLFKAKRKQRKSVNKAGKRRCDTTSLDYRKSAKEPWVLVTSLPVSSSLAKQVVKKYSTRMQIEESFRDLKSTRYGFGFENAYTQGIKRIEILLLIAMLASFIAWLTGWVAEKMGLHYQFQSNTTKNRRVLSLFFLGCQVIRRKIRILVGDLIAALEANLDYVA